MEKSVRLDEVEESRRPMMWIAGLGGTVACCLIRATRAETLVER